MKEAELLSKLGFSGNESQIYLVLLRSGPRSAYDIAQRTGMYRPHVYDKLETLVSKGLVSFVQRGKRRIFSAAHPSKIRIYLEEREEAVKAEIKTLDDSMPSLEALYRLPQEDTKVEVFSGPEGLKLVLNQIADSEEKDIRIIGIDERKYLEYFPAYINQYFKKLRARGAKERVIAAKSRDPMTFDNGVTSYRFFDVGVISPSDMIIFSGNVVIIIWGVPIVTILIANRDLAETYRKYFEFVWKLGGITNFSSWP
jgi:sugar-specific transcriptional regulator TrmB